MTEGAARSPDGGDEFSLLEFALPIASHIRLVVLLPLVLGLAAVGLSFLVAPTFTAGTSLLPPQSQQNPALSAAALGALGNIAGLSSSVKSPADQYVSLLQSTTIADRLVDRFGLMKVYDVTYRFQARRRLADSVRISLGRRDGIISIEVDDHDPQRAADIANQYVAELARLTGELALSEAQRRRVFFEAQLKQTQERLSKAQEALERSGFNTGALRAEPKAAAEAFARLQAETTAAEVRLQTLRRSLADDAAEVQQQQAFVRALRSQLARLEASNAPATDGDYIGKYRQFKYQEALLDMFARQYELARLDESREGALVQVIDPATPPEWKSRPKRAVIGVTTTLASFGLLVGYLLGRHAWRAAASAPASAARISRLRAALRNR